MKTYSAKPKDVVRKWYLLDASEAPLGRLATKAATLLTGKNKPSFTHHIDTGDFVVVINADKLIVTGNKLAGKKYYRYSGYPSGLTETTLSEQLAKDSTQVIIHAIRGMLPLNKLRKGRLERLKVYAGSDQPHAPQNPITITLKGLNK